MKIPERNHWELLRFWSNFSEIFVELKHFQLGFSGDLCEIRVLDDEFGELLRNQWSIWDECGFDCDDSGKIDELGFKDEDESSSSFLENFVFWFC
jgi:hypothetical protein